MIPWRPALFALLVATPAAAIGQDAHEDTLEAALQVIEERFPGQVDRGTLYRAAVAGVADQLDIELGVQGNRLLTEDEHEGIQGWLKGERTGIGVEFSIVPSQGLLLTDVYEDSPAWRSHLAVGDLVVGMDDHPLTGLSASAIHDVVVQSTGHRVALDVRRATGPLRRMTLVRETYRIGSIHRVDDPDTPFVRVAFFGEGAADELAQALAGLDGAGAVGLDLRDAPGGLIEEVVAAADLFLPPGSVVLHRVSADGMAKPDSVSGERVWDGGVVILANRGTQGPAEAFVAALQEHRVAMVVGTPTAGQSALVSYHPIGHGLVLQLADVVMQGPTGRVWSRDGVEPDVLVEPMDRSMPVRPGEAPLDLQRDAAIRLMRSRPE